MNPGEKLVKGLNRYSPRKREAFRAVAAAAGTIAALPLLQQSNTHEYLPPVRGMRIGTSYSQREIEWLGLNHDAAFNTVTRMGFDFLRLTTYPNEVQESRGNFDFANPRRMLDICESGRIPVVMVIGFWKAFRHPEFYQPRWAADLKNIHQPSDFGTYWDLMQSHLQTTIEALAPYTCITHWQVENEPLDPTGEGKWAIPQDLLAKEIAFVRSKDRRPIAINLWGNDLSSRGFLPVAEQLADVIGVDLYPRQYVAPGIYRGPADPNIVLRAMFTSNSKPVWGMEIQAEGWEGDQAAKESTRPYSLPDFSQTERNIRWAHSLGLQTVGVWGFEDMYRRYVENNDSSHLDGMASLLAQR
jgi:hypothetical protein